MIYRGHSSSLFLWLIYYYMYDVLVIWCVAVKSGSCYAAWISSARSSDLSALFRHQSKPNASHWLAHSPCGNFCIVAWQPWVGMSTRPSWWKIIAHQRWNKRFHKVEHWFIQLRNKMMSTVRGIGGHSMWFGGACKVGRDALISFSERSPQSVLILSCSHWCVMPPCCMIIVHGWQVVPKHWSSSVGKRSW